MKYPGYLFTERDLRQKWASHESLIRCHFFISATTLGFGIWSAIFDMHFCAVENGTGVYLCFGVCMDCLFLSACFCTFLLYLYWLSCTRRLYSSFCA
jgi:hypothetical protein